MTAQIAPVAQVVVPDTKRLLARVGGKETIDPAYRRRWYGAVRPIVVQGWLFSLGSPGALIGGTAAGMATDHVLVGLGVCLAGWAAMIGGITRFERRVVEHKPLAKRDKQMLKKAHRNVIEAVSAAARTQGHVDPAEVAEIGQADLWQMASLLDRVEKAAASGDSPSSVQSTQSDQDRRALRVEAGLIASRLADLESSMRGLADRITTSMEKGEAVPSAAQALAARARMLADGVDAVQALGGVGQAVLPVVSVRADHSAARAVAEDVA